MTNLRIRTRRGRWFLDAEATQRINDARRRADLRPDELAEIFGLEQIRLDLTLSGLNPVSPLMLVLLAAFVDRHQPARGGARTGAGGWV